MISLKVLLTGTSKRNQGSAYETELRKFRDRKSDVYTDGGYKANGGCQGDVNKVRGSCEFEKRQKEIFKRSWGKEDNRFVHEEELVDEKREGGGKRRVNRGRRMGLTKRKRDKKQYHGFGLKDKQLGGNEDKVNDKSTDEQYKTNEREERGENENHGRNH